MRRAPRPPVLAPSGDRTFERLLAGAALLVACLVTLRAVGWGDYTTDGGPAVDSLAHGDIGAFFAHQPAMGALSLYVRAPFAALAVALHDRETGIYLWGCLPCVLSVAGLGVWLARVARQHGTGRLGQSLIVAVALLNPLINDAIYWGHPEELLTASLAVGALLAAGQRRTLLTAVLAGLAIVSKQWALIILVPALLALERERLRALAIAGATAALVTLPMVVGNFAAFRHALSYISRPQPVMTFFTWLYPFSPTEVVHVTNLFGASRDYVSRGVWPVESAISHPLIIILGAAVPAWVWWRRGRRLRGEDLLTVSALLFVLRCGLDPGTGAYYHAPLLLTLLALDATAGRRVPVVGLAGGAVCFVVFTRFAPYLDPRLTNAAYIVATLILAALLVGRLRGTALAAPALGQRAGAGALATALSAGPSRP